MSQPLALFRRATEDAQFLLSLRSGERLGEGSIMSQPLALFRRATAIRFDAFLTSFSCDTPRIGLLSLTLSSRGGEGTTLKLNPTEL
jgi:hypothetical protein